MTSLPSNFNNFNSNSSTWTSLSPAQRRIVEALSKENRPLNAKEIAQLSGVKLSTVRVYLCKLAKRGIIKREFRGHYSAILTNPPMGWQAPQRRANSKEVRSIRSGEALCFSANWRNRGAGLHQRPPYCPGERTQG